MEENIRSIEKKMNRVFDLIEKDKRKYKYIMRELYKELINKSKIITNLKNKYES